MHHLSNTDYKKLSKAERRKRRRATPKYRNLHASRERFLLKLNTELLYITHNLLNNYNIVIQL
ncbi:unnamed protein product [Thelazia callipaeda]|uniref:Transposase n=1 Tax=Thelazia callipaeda TaxID=103827 RepID=A0A0N5CMY2_THECL|nr:unnamed protein product [Thelazia callipaeda]